MRLQRRNYGRGHGYKVDGQKVLGVTTILNSLPKEALINWAANVTAEKAINEWDELAAMPPAARLKELQDARWNVTKAAALRGTQIHDLGEKVSKGEDVHVPDEHVGPVQAYARFLDRWDVEVIATETPVASINHQYAGTADVWATIGKLGGARVLLDLKTGKGVYEATALQLAAYRYADIWQPAKDAEEALPPVDDVYVAHILPDDVRLLPAYADGAAFRQFLYLMQTARWLTAAKDDPPIGAALTPPPLEETA